MFPNSRSEHRPLPPPAPGGISTKPRVKGFILKSSQCFSPTNGSELQSIKMNYFGWELKYLKRHSMWRAFGAMSRVINNTFYSSLDREIALLITVPLSQCDPKWPNTFINSLFTHTASLPTSHGLLCSQLAGEDMGLCIIPTSRHCGLLLLASPQRFPYKRNLVLKGT